MNPEPPPAAPAVEAAPPALPPAAPAAVPAQGATAGPSARPGAPGPGLIVAWVVAVLALAAVVLLWQKVSSMQEQLARQSAEATSQSVEARTLARQADTEVRDALGRLAALDGRVGDLAAYRIAYERLMMHWRDALPGRMIEIDYEALIADQEGESRRLVAACGLDWEGACLDFHRNPAPVATASAVQVRAPIHDRSVGL